MENLIIPDIVINIIMKKFIIILLALLTFSCSSENKEEHEYTLVYKVYYPGNTVEKETTFCSSKECKYILSSYKGSNFLTVCEKGRFEDHFLSRVISTTAPIEVIYFDKTK